MTDRIDKGLQRLNRAASGHALDRLESDVWTRVQERAQSDVFGGHVLRAQIAVTAVALVVGFLMADMVSRGTAPVRSEISVLSDAIAPSVLLEGGA